MSIRVILAEDQNMVREGIARLLQDEEDFEVVAQASDGEEAVNIIIQEKPDIALINIEMPKLNGIDVLKMIKENKINSRIIFLTGHTEPTVFKSAFELCCDGYVLKSSSIDILKEAIRNVRNGQKYYEKLLLDNIDEYEKISCKETEALSELTKREKEVLRYIAKGMLNREIAITMTISERTVKNHISNIFKKLDVSDRTQAAVMALKNNLV